MTLQQILPLLDRLPRTEQLQLMEILLSRLATEERTEVSAVGVQRSIRENPAFGMWADRTESTQEQLREIRQRHWGS